MVRLRTNLDHEECRAVVPTVQRLQSTAHWVLCDSSSDKELNMNITSLAAMTYNVERKLPQLQEQLLNMTLAIRRRPRTTECDALRRE